MTAAAIQATYHDLRFVKTRKVAQVTLEIPIEQAQAFVELFGTPNPATETWVAVARLSLTAQKQEQAKAIEAPKERRPFNTLPRPQQAALRCNERAFREFLRGHLGYAPDTAEDTAEAVRKICGVNSRSDLDTRPASEKWDRLNGQFEAWMRHVI